MKRVITLITAVLCLGLVVPGTFSQQPTIPPKQNAQAAKAPVSADVPAELKSAKEKLASARKDVWSAGEGAGEFRQKAIQNIDEALTNIEKAEEYYRKNKQK
jgi:hypothetical protein